MENIEEVTKREQMTLLLKKAGWYPNRKINISNFERQCIENGIELFDSAQKFLEQFTGLDKTVYFKSYHPVKEIGLSLHDYSFYFISSPTEEIDFVDDYKAILDFANEDCFYLGESGYHYPAVVAIGRSGKLYFKHDYSEDVWVFNDLIESMERELGHHNIETSSLYK
ncbi:SUKH-3 domain-containing protein [Inconstantimicrobium mannanitabidum]|uniref:Uncharacterized protein n=1 Tax=Inconstantimicrobium mannanitabidum TaxID=1604901 RepID=A0ACB5RAW5_9CLOT|nr:SUKH-3 domain-containing protein [Clostridium sp. TW13]GKX66345.1 hypothetical protein rsdtw13_16030 [Clostridium sp. TW13]